MNSEADIFMNYFDEMETLSGAADCNTKYLSLLPKGRVAVPTRLCAGMVRNSDLHTGTPRGNLSREVAFSGATVRAFRGDLI